jgi:hypothetical protein
MLTRSAAYPATRASDREILRAARYRMPGTGVLPVGCDRWHHLRVDTDWELAYTVDLEHMTRRVGDRTQSRTLRCTQAYRRENGEWKVVLRHADELPGKDEQRR